MRIASTTKDLGSSHEETVVGLAGNVFILDRLKVTGPSSSRIKFVIRTKQRLFAAYAIVRSIAFVIPKLVLKSSFRALLSSYIKLLLGKDFFPFGICFWQCHDCKPCLSIRFVGSIFGCLRAWILSGDSQDVVIWIRGHCHLAAIR